MSMMYQCSEKTVLFLCSSGGTFALISIYLHHLQTYDTKVLVTCKRAGETYTDVKGQRQRLTESWDLLLKHLLPKLIKPRI